MSSFPTGIIAIDLSQGSDRVPARRALRKLPEKAAAAVEFSYGSLADYPRRAGKPLRYELADLPSARRGDYRVIYRINANQHQVEIVAIEHRADAYRPR
jgi:mRNA-degrading endonuclease RelE of RelBE toxin-antitoxin system